MDRFLHPLVVLERHNRGGVTFGVSQPRAREAQPLRPGLKNGANWCHLNVVLQSLGSVVWFWHWLLDHLPTSPLTPAQQLILDYAVFRAESVRSELYAHTIATALGLSTGQEDAFETFERVIKELGAWGSFEGYYEERRSWAQHTKDEVQATPYLVLGHGRTLHAAVAAALVADVERTVAGVAQRGQVLQVLRDPPPLLLLRQAVRRPLALQSRLVLGATTYVLRVVVTHRGTQAAGHYRTCVEELHRVYGDRGWVRYDDGTCEDLPDLEAICEPGETPSILLLLREDLAALEAHLPPLPEAPQLATARRRVAEDNLTARLVVGQGIAQSRGPSVLAAVRARALALQRLASPPLDFTCLEVFVATHLRGDRGSLWLALHEVLGGEPGLARGLLAARLVALDPTLASLLVSAPLDDPEVKALPHVPKVNCITGRRLTPWPAAALSDEPGLEQHFARHRRHVGQIEALCARVAVAETQTAWAAGLGAVAAYLVRRSTAAEGLARTRRVELRHLLLENLAPFLEDASPTPERAFLYLLVEGLRWAEGAPRAAALAAPRPAALHELQTDPRFEESGLEIGSPARYMQSYTAACRAGRRLVHVRV